MKRGNEHISNGMLVLRKNISFVCHLPHILDNAICTKSASHLVKNVDLMYTKLVKGIVL